MSIFIHKYAHRLKMKPGLNQKHQVFIYLFSKPGLMNYMKHMTLNIKLHKLNIFKASTLGTKILVQLHVIKLSVAC